MGIYDGIAGAKTFETGQYFVDGTYDVTILSHKDFVSQRDDVTPYYAVECEVDAVHATKKGADGEPLIRPGDVRSWVQKLTEPSCVSNVKKFMQNFLGDEFEGKDAKAANSPEEQAFAGERMRLVCFPYTSKKSGNEITIHEWSRLEE